MIDFLRSPDDERAEAATHRATLAAFAGRQAQSLGDCPICGMVETLLIGDRCHVCEQAAAWSRDNRALCNLIHRGGV